LWFALNHSPSLSARYLGDYQIEMLRKVYEKINTTVTKIVQFVLESLKEQELELRQTNHKLFRDGYKYIFECQLAGQITSLLLVYTAKSFTITSTADKSGDCTFIASWIKCLLDNVPAIPDIFMKRFYDKEKVNHTLWHCTLKNKFIIHEILQEISPINRDAKCFQKQVVPKRCVDIYCIGLFQIYYLFVFI
jgi:hypothetical protein